MFLETQGIVDVDGAMHWEYRVFMLSGDIVIWHEPITSERGAKDILADARACYLADTNDGEGD